MVLPLILGTAAAALAIDALHSLERETPTVARTTTSAPTPSPTPSPSSTAPNGIPASEWGPSARLTLGRLLQLETDSGETDWKAIPFALLGGYTQRRAGDIRSGRPARTFEQHMKAYNEGYRAQAQGKPTSARFKRISVLAWDALKPKVRAAVEAFERNALVNPIPTATDWAAPGFRTAGGRWTRVGANVPTVNEFWRYG